MCNLWGRSRRRASEEGGEILVDFKSGRWYKPPPESVHFVTMMDERLISAGRCGHPRLLGGGDQLRSTLKLCGGGICQDLVQETFLRAYKKWKQFENAQPHGSTR
jgi:hypothetical protein